MEALISETCSPKNQGPSGRRAVPKSDPKVRTCELTISGRYQAVRFSLSWDLLQMKVLTSWKLGHLLSEILWLFLVANSFQKFAVRTWENAENVGVC